MHTCTDTDGTLAVTHDSTLWSKVLFGLALLLMATAAYDYFVGTWHTNRLIGLLAGVATCALGGVVTLDQARIRVDPRTRTIAWDRRWGFRRRSGALSFDEVTSIGADRPVGDDGVPSRRIVLWTRDGRRIPLSAGYQVDANGDVLRTVEQIRRMLGRGDGESSEFLQSLIDGGRIIDAVKLLRETRGLSISEAKSEIDALKKQR
jgi:hypothetical protein